MWLPLVHTLACLSLINGGLYALHLNSNNAADSSSSSSTNSHGSGAAAGADTGPLSPHSSSNIGGNNKHYSNNKLEHSSNSHPPGGGSSSQQVYSHSLQHLLPPPPSSQALNANNRYGEQLADMAQLDRERLMLLGLAKQTAAAGAAATGHHGRPIVTGRIQMTPADDVYSDYPSLLLQQARGFMFGNVVKQPKHSPDYEGEDGDADYEDEAEVLPRHYEYGRVVQPPPLPTHQQQRESHHQFAGRNHDLNAAPIYDWAPNGNSEPDVEEILPDLDSYQYLDELLAEQQLQDDEGWHHWPQQEQHDQPQPPFHVGHMTQQQHQLDTNPPAALQELFEEAERQQQQRQEKATAASNRNKPRYEASTRNMQLKWQRKRGQQQFLTHKTLQQHLGQRPQQKQHFGRQHSSRLTLASALKAEALATKQQQQQQQPSTATSSSSNAKSAEEAAESGASSDSGNVPTSAAAASTNELPQQPQETQQKQLQQQQQNQQQQQLHPNHKRSGIGAGTAGANIYTPLQPPPPPQVTHSIANQLMLRTARGQRQYDVPQIECPTAMDGMERFACPTPDLQGRYRCIDDHVLCDGFIDCPEGEDEDRRSCMFYKTTKAHLDVLADALLRWARGR